MQFRLSLEINVMRLAFAPVRGRRTLYVSLHMGSRTFWLMRWDTERALKHKPFAYSRDRLMCWSAGHRT